MKQSRGRGITGVALIAVVALLLRAAGVGFLLPHLIEPDAHVVRQVELMDLPGEEARADLNWGKYPHLLARLLWILPDGTDAPPPPDDLEAHLQRAAWPVLRARWLVALLSVAIVPGTWLVARRFMPSAWALVPAWLVATSLLHLTFSQQARPHAPSAALLVCAVAAACRLRARNDMASYLLAALAAFLVVGSLQTGVAIALPLAVAFFLRERGPGHASPFAVLLPAGAVVLALLVLSPFLFAGSAGKDGGQLELHEGGLMQSGHVIIFAGFQDRGFQKTLHTLWSYEPVGLVLAAVGLLAWIAGGRPAGRNAEAGSRRDLLVVLAFVLPYLLVLSLYARTYERLVLPLVPFVACLAGSGLRSACRALRRAVPAPWGTALATAVLGAACLLPAHVATRLAAIRSRPDTASEVAAWVASELEPGGETVSLPRALTLPLFQDDAALRANSLLVRSRLPHWVSYQAGLEEIDGQRWSLPWIPLGTRRLVQSALEDPHGYLDGLEADYVVVEDYRARRRDPLMTNLYDALRERGELVLRCSPDTRRGVLAHRLAYQDEPTGAVPNATARVLSARCTGPVLEVYRLPR